MEKTISIHGRDTHYWTYGNASKPLLIMIHGFRGTHHGLLPIVDKLRDFYIIVPDLPGFGVSQAMPKHDLDSYVSWLHSFCQTMSGGQKFSLLGHSFGSIIVSHYAASYPKETTKIILVNPISTSALDGSKKIATKLASFYYYLSEKLPDRPSRALLSNGGIVKIMSIAMTVSKDRQMRNFIHDQHKKYFSNFQTTASVMEAFKTSTEHTINTTITQPTLLVVGENDMIAPLEGQYVAAKNIVNSELVTIDKVGHLIHYEKPKQAAEAIKDFLLK